MATGLENLRGDGDLAPDTGSAGTARHAASPVRLRFRVGRVLGGALLAVLGLVVGIASLLVLTDGTPAGGGPTVAGPAVSALTRTAPSTEPVGTQPAAATAPAAAASASVPVSPTAAASPVVSGSPAASASPSPSSAASAVAVPPMTVFNNSRIAGLGSRAATRVRAAGFTVAAVGNYTGRIPVSTLYFAPGQDAAAAQVAAAVAGIERVLPRFDGLPGSGLTLVVTRDFPA